MLREIRSVNHMYKDRVSFITKKKKNIQWHLKTVRLTLLSMLRIGTTAKRFSRGWGERTGSTANTAWASGNFQPRSTEGVREWKTPKRKYQELGAFWLNQPNKVLLKTSQGNQTSLGGEVGWRIKNLIRHPEWSDMEGERNFFLKLDFTTNHTDRPWRRF